MKSTGSNLPRSHVALLAWCGPDSVLFHTCCMLKSTGCSVTFLCCLFWDLVLMISPLETEPMSGPCGWETQVSEYCWEEGFTPFEAASTWESSLELGWVTEEAQGLREELFLVNSLALVLALLWSWCYLISIPPVLFSDSLEKGLSYILCRLSKSSSVSSESPGCPEGKAQWSFYEYFHPTPV